MLVSNIEIHIAVHMPKPCQGPVEKPGLVPSTSVWSLCPALRPLPPAVTVRLLTLLLPVESPLGWGHRSQRAITMGKVT